MSNREPSFRCGRSGGLGAFALIALWAALCVGFVAATRGRGAPEQREPGHALLEGALPQVAVDTSRDCTR